MIKLNEYILKEEFKEIIEELNTDDNTMYILMKETDKYRLYFHKHFLSRRSRDKESYGGKFINNDKVFKLIDKNYNKILDKYNSRKLSYSKTDKEAFALIDNSKIDKLIIIGFINNLDKTDNKYEICLKTLMIKTGKEKFTPKNDKEYYTLPIILEQLEKENNLILIYNE